MLTAISLQAGFRLGIVSINYGSRSMVGNGRYGPAGIKQKASRFRTGPKLGGLQGVTADEHATPIYSLNCPEQLSRRFQLGWSLRFPNGLIWGRGDLLSWGILETKLSFKILFLRITPTTQWLARYARHEDYELKGRIVASQVYWLVMSLLSSISRSWLSIPPLNDSSPPRWIPWRSILHNL